MILHILVKIILILKFFYKKVQLSNNSVSFNHQVQIKLALILNPILIFWLNRMARLAFINFFSINYNIIYEYFNSNTFAKLNFQTKLFKKFGFVISLELANLKN